MDEEDGEIVVRVWAGNALLFCRSPTDDDANRDHSHALLSQAWPQKRGAHLAEIGYCFWNQKQFDEVACANCADEDEHDGFDRADAVSLKRE